MSAPALDPEGPLSFSLSHTGRALIFAPAEYHLLNPATLAHSTGFNAGAYYLFGTGRRKPAYGVSLSENRKLPLALSYIRERRSDERYLSLSTAGFVLPGWSLGVSLSRWQKDERADWNIQAGFLIRPKASPFSLAGVWDHILPLEGAFEHQRRWALAVGYELYKGISLRADAFYKAQEKWFIGLGLESLLSRFLALRLSAGRHFEKESFVFSGGIGLLAENMALDYGLSFLEEQDHLHSIKVRFSF